MNTSEMIVVVLGLGAIAWVNWYFFMAGRSVAMAAGPAMRTGTAGGSGGMPEATIVVDGGYSPNTVRVPAGTTVRLLFDRRDNSSCSEEVVFPDFGIRKYLPTGQTTAVEITPKTPGKYGFTCGMSMLRGTVIAE